MLPRLVQLLLPLAAAYSPALRPAVPAGAVRCAAPALILLEPEVAARAPAAATRLLGDVFSRFHGHFDNHAQVVANEAAGLSPRHGGGHEHIHCALRAVEIPGAFGSGHVLATYYFNGQPEVVFRQRLYALDALAADAQFGSCVRMGIYRIRPETAARLREAGGAGGTPGALTLSAADVSEELRVPGADVFWRRCGERLEARMRTDSVTLASERDPTQNLVIRDDVALWDDALWVNDRGSDAETGEYVYGNIHGVPYKMARVPDDHWTSVGGEQPE